MTANVPRRVLVVDDEPVMRAFCETVLRKYGYVSLCAGNGLQALDLYRENYTEISLVITDTSMPVMDGVTFAQKLLTFNRECKIILMTGYSATHTYPPGLKLQCPLLVKPFSSADLIAAVRNCLGAALT